MERNKFRILGGEFRAKDSKWRVNSTQIIKSGTGEISGESLNQQTSEARHGASKRG